MTTPAHELAFPSSSLTPDAGSRDSMSEPCAAHGRAAAFHLSHFIASRLLSDENLAAELQSGNPEALTELFRRHSRLLFVLTRRITRDSAEAEDIVQQTFFDVFRSIHQFDAKRGTFKNWLLLFAYHRALNHVRTRHAHRHFATVAIEDIHDLALCPHSLAEKRVLAQQVLGMLPARQRQTIELIYYEGLTAAEAASRTRQSVRVVRHNLYRGLEKLRKAFAGLGSSSPAQKKGGL